MLVTTAEEPWTKAASRATSGSHQPVRPCHWLPARAAAARNWTGLLGSLVRRLVFAVPLRDVHSPCRLHRLDKLAAIPLQSASSFLDTEILAKATFLGHLIDEVAVPPLRGARDFTWLVDGLESSPRPSAVRPIVRSSGRIAMRE